MCQRSTQHCTTLVDAVQPVPTQLQAACVEGCDWKGKAAEVNRQSLMHNESTRPKCRDAVVQLSGASRCWRAGQRRDAGSRRKWAFWSAAPKVGRGLLGIRNAGYCASWSLEVAKTDCKVARNAQKVVLGRGVRQPQVPTYLLCLKLSLPDKGLSERIVPGQVPTGRANAHDLTTVGT